MKHLSDGFLIHTGLQEARLSKHDQETVDGREADVVPMLPNISWVEVLRSTAVRILVDFRVRNVDWKTSASTIRYEYPYSYIRVGTRGTYVETRDKFERMETRRNTQVSAWIILRSLSSLHECSLREKKYVRRLTTVKFGC